MIKSTLWQFEMTVDGEQSRHEVFALAEVLSNILPKYAISAESAKSDLVILRIGLDEAAL